MARRPKHIPLRTCVGCRTQKPKCELLRIVRRPTGEVVIDVDGKAPGRGAYLCPTESCLDRARKAASLNHSLKCKIPDGLWVRLREWTTGGAAGGNSCSGESVQVPGSQSQPT